MATGVSPPADWSQAYREVHLPVPAGWRTETIPFPLGFAPGLPYRGLEELRFAPGMFRPGAEDFWTYSFVWVLEDAVALDPEALATDLEVYFDGLTAAVRASKQLGPAGLEATCSLRVAGEGLVGTARLLDAFATQEPVELHVRLSRLEPPAGSRGALYFELSPRPLEHPVWETLASMGEGYRPRPAGA